MSSSTNNIEVIAPPPAEFLSFVLGKEEYGIDIQKVRELRGYNAVTSIANTPDFVKGVINLRGVIVPIIDLRIKLGLGNPVYNDFTVVIVFSMRGTTVGIVADSVSDVIELAADEIKPAPQLGNQDSTSYLTGIGTRGDRMVLLVDIERLISADDCDVIELQAA